MITLLLLVWAFFSTFTFCFIGEVMKNQFDTYNETLCNTNWYFFSLEMQQMLMIFLKIVQQSATIHGSGNVVCTREVFKRVSVENTLRSNEINQFNCTIYFRPSIKGFVILTSFAQSDNKGFFLYIFYRLWNTQLKAFLKIFDFFINK